MAKSKCKIAGCREDHHAKGYCNRHYKKFTRLGSPTAGRDNESGPRQRRKLQTAQPVIADPPQYEPEKRKKPGSGQGNYNFFLNQKFIEKLYKEALKARKEIVYKTVNAHHIPHYLTLALLLSGYDRTDHELTADIIDELETWLGCGDVIRFMETLANWEKRADEWDRKRGPRKTQQLTFFK